jgi:hypothetical protein
MTRSEALKAAEECFDKVRTSQGYNIGEAQAARLQALAEAGKGYILLANSMRLE